jgi:hypothetical protein
LVMQVPNIFLILLTLWGMRRLNAQIWDSCNRIKIPLYLSRKSCLITTKNLKTCKKLWEDH